MAVGRWLIEGFEVIRCMSVLTKGYFVGSGGVDAQLCKPRHSDTLTISPEPSPIPECGEKNPPGCPCALVSSP